MTKLLAGSFEKSLPRMQSKSSPWPFHCARKPSQVSAASPLPGLQRRAPGRPAGFDIFDLFDVDAGGVEHGIADRLPAGAAEQDRLAFEILDALRLLALAEGEVEHVGAAHVEHRDERNALFEAEREHARRGIADVRLLLVDELDGRGRVRRARAPASSRCRRNSRTSWRPNRDSRRAPRACRAATPSGSCRPRRRARRPPNAAERGGGHAARRQRQKAAAIRSSDSFMHCRHSAPPSNSPASVFAPRPVFERAHASQLAHFFPSQKKNT